MRVSMLCLCKCRVHKKTLFWHPWKCGWLWWTWEWRACNLQTPASLCSLNDSCVWELFNYQMHKILKRMFSVGAHFKSTCVWTRDISTEKRSWDSETNWCVLGCGSLRTPWAQASENWSETWYKLQLVYAKLLLFFFLLSNLSEASINPPV